MRIDYSSDLIVRDPSQLATLLVFYDSVVLPWTSAETAMYAYGCRKRGAAFEIDGTRIQVNWIKDGRPNSLATQVMDWERENSVLFAEGVLSRMAPTETGGRSLPHGSTLTIAAPVVEIFPWGSDLPTEHDAIIWADHLSHILRSDLGPYPTFALSKFADRELLKTLIASCVLKYIVPNLDAISPESILEVRRLVKDTREGFSMHLQTLSAELEKKLNGGESIPEVTRYAQGIAETSLLPSYREYVRQIRGKRGGFWSKVLDPVAQVAVQIDSAVWTPKFYAQLFRAIGLASLGASETMSEGLTNKIQAYQFMRKVEIGASEL